MRVLKGYIMAVFKYHALTDSGRLMKGTLEAASKEQADQALQEMNLKVEMLEKDTQVNTERIVNRSELLLFNQQLASMTQAGIPLDKGIREIAGDVASGSTRKLLEGIADDLEKGVAVDQAFEKRKSLFPVLYGQIVKAGIKSGRLNEMLVSLNKHLITSIQMRQTLIEALTYPAIVFIVALTVITGVLKGVVPSFKGVISDMGSDIPPMTQWILTWPRYVDYAWLGLILITVAIVFTHYYARYSKPLKSNLEGLYGCLPVIGRMYRCSGLSKLADSLALLINSGSDIPDAIELAAATTGRQGIITDCNTIAQRIRSGENFVEASEGCNTLPGIFMYSAQLGIQRNELSDNLYNLSEMYQEQTRIFRGRIQAILTPIMIVFLGFVISLIVIGLFMPLVRMIEDLG